MLSLTNVEISVWVAKASAGTQAKKEISRWTSKHTETDASEGKKECMQQEG